MTDNALFWFAIFAALGASVLMVRDIDQRISALEACCVCERNP